MNELSYTTTYNFASSGFSVGLTTTDRYSVTGSGRAIGRDDSVAVGQVKPLDFGSLANVYLLSLKNLNPTSGTLYLATNPSITGGNIIRPSDAVILFPQTTGYWVSGSVAPITYSYVANEA